MKFITLTALVAVTVPLFLQASEPSAFGAGNLNNPNPYGLTQSERVLLETKKNLRKVEVKSNNQAYAVDDLKERLDGFETILDSIGKKAHQNRLNLQKMKDETLADKNNRDEFEKRVSIVTQTNSDNIEKIKLVIRELSHVIDSINAKYVSKDEFNKLVNDVNSFKSLMAKELKNEITTKSTTSKSSLSGMSNSQIDKAAQKFYQKKYYTKAIEYYTYLISKKYRPAHSHYMIGEMKFKRKNYGEAISYFKKSASLYSKASYMPTLLLHTAISMDKTHDKKNAKTFYNAVVVKYPNSPEAKEAKKHL
jgi:TolA-binding protein